MDIKRGAWLPVLLLLAGCANRWLENYQAYLDKPYHEYPMLDVDCDREAERREPRSRAYEQQAWEEGLYPVGRSSFVGTGSVNFENGWKIGDDVCADVVTIVAIPGGSHSGSITLPGAPVTSTTTSATNTFGPGGATSTYGTAHTTMPGQDVSVPYTVNYYQFVATYWVRSRQIFGVLAEDMDRDERIAAKIKHGIVVGGVVRDSPAYDSDILRGDIIITCDDHPIASVDDFSACEIMRAGKQVEIGILRDGEEQTIVTRFNKAPAALRRLKEEAEEE